MTYTTAQKQAQKAANQNGTSILLYCDPIGQGEQDGADKPWGFCPRDAAELIARFRQKAHDMMIHPQGKHPTRVKKIEYAYPSSERGGTDGLWFVGVYNSDIEIDPVQIHSATSMEHASEIAESLPEPYSKYSLASGRCIRCDEPIEPFGPSAGAKLELEGLCPDCANDMLEEKETEA